MKTTQVETFDITTDTGIERIEHFRFTPEHESLGLSAFFKKIPEDFQVEEQLKFELSGEGQHLCLLIEKRLLNTMQVVTILSRFFQIHPRAVGYLGMKDKVAVTQQWFSIDLAESEFNESHIQNFDDLKHELMQKLPDIPLQVKKKVSLNILQTIRNTKKLQVGQLKGNRFELVLRDIRSKNQEDFDVIRGVLEKRLEYIRQHGFPNYFGSQRFGHQQQNIQQLSRIGQLNLGKRRGLRSRLISSARSLGFNCYLSERVEKHTFRTYLEGDVLQFSDGKTVFREIESVEEVQKRLIQGEIVVTGPLFAGDQASLATAESLTLELSVKQSLGSLLDILQLFGLKPARRALISWPQKMTWYFSANDLFLQFELDAGAFASVLVQELVDNLNV